MSELITSRRNARDLRWQFLTTVSAVALLTSVHVESAQAGDASRPTVWIELGGQLERMTNKEEPYAAPFTLANLDHPMNVESPLAIQKPPRYSFGGEGKISFEPEGTDWAFSAGIRFGRSNGTAIQNHQMVTEFNVGTVKYYKYHHAVPYKLDLFNNSQVEYKNNHMIVDFSAGKDVGLGLFGSNAASQISAGVRIAQFGAETDVTFRSLPDQYIHLLALVNPALPNARRFHSYYAHAYIDRSFRGIGPSLAWEGHAFLAGNSDSGRLTFDWGANAAVLFGRQKVSGSHETHTRYRNGPLNNLDPAALPVDTTTVVSIRRSHSVSIPNVGAFAGMSVRYSNAKFSFGYRGDFFFAAIDGGIDARKTYDRNFYGPFATVSIGLP